jgi:hypothetical protein
MPDTKYQNCVVAAAEMTNDPIVADSVPPQGLVTPANFHCATFSPWIPEYPLEKIEDTSLDRSGQPC